MNLNLALINEQQQRIASDYVAVEAEVVYQTDRFEIGVRDAMLGQQPSIEGWKSDLNYRHGWLSGIAQRYDQQIGTSYSEPF